MIEIPQAARVSGSHHQTMDGTIADARPGARLDLTVEFITKRPLGREGAPVHRLLVADQTGKRFSILTTSDSDSLWHLETGATYEISDLLCGCPIDATHAPIGECPECGGELRPGQAVDTVDGSILSAVTELGIDDVFGIIDATASVEAIDVEAGVVDDWQTMEQEQSPQIIETPDQVCRSCSRHFDEIDLHPESHHDVNESVQSAPAMDNIGTSRPT